LESKIHYTLVGFFVLLLLGSMIATCLWLSVKFDKRSYNTYVVYLSEPVNGLTEESPVKYNGVKVGQVRKIILSPSNPQKVKVELSIAEGTPITVSTKATLVAMGITGVTCIGLVADTESMELLQTKPGEQYPVIPYKASFLNQLEKNFGNLSEGLQKILNAKNTENVGKILSDAQSVTTVFAQNDKNIDKSLQNLPILISELNVSVKSLQKMMLDAAVAARQITSTMKTGKTSIDQISQQAIPLAITALRRIDAITANLEKVSADMRKNPAVIIRGSASAKLGPGESR
jgi:phospholipid/cholesterol/gamma-HCH transport system substrate-binding protein